MPTFYVFDQLGRRLYGPDERCDAQGDFPAGFATAKAAELGGLPCISAHNPGPHVIVTVEAGAIVPGSLRADPDYMPPDPPLDPVAELKAAVDQNLMASPHDRRFLAQKEAAKTVMWWIRENPDCTAGQVLTQVEAAIAAETPGEPVVVSGQGLLETYAHEAHQRGLIPAATWEALKALILASTPAQLTRMLATV